MRSSAHRSVHCGSGLADGLACRVQDGFTLIPGTLRGVTRSRGSAGTVDQSTYWLSVQHGDLRAVGILKQQLVSPRGSFPRDLGRGYKAIYNSLGNPSILLFLLSLRQANH